MVSDQEIARGVEILLRQSQSDPQLNAAVTSSAGATAAVVHHLGAKLGLDLSHKTAFIRHHINNLIHPSLSPPPPPPPSHFAFQPPHALPYPQQQQQQQFLPAQFAFGYPGFPTHAPPPANHHAPPTIQPHPVAAPVSLPPSTPKKNASVKAPTESTQPATKRRGGGGGLNKLCGVSPELQAIVGEASMARTEIVRQLWVYIRKHNLQDPSNKRKIICDEPLRAVFETDCTDMFKMNKLLSKHILPLATAKDSDASKRQKVDVESPAETTEKASAVVISDALALFLGTTRKEMSLTEAAQHVLEYIKANSLEDPSSMMITCDSQLRELFGCESIPVSGISELLARDHLFKSS